MICPIAICWTSACSFDTSDVRPQISRCLQKSARGSSHHQSARRYSPAYGCLSGHTAYLRIEAARLLALSGNARRALRGSLHPQLSASSPLIFSANHVELLDAVGPRANASRATDRAPATAAGCAGCRSQIAGSCVAAHSRGTRRRTGEPRCTVDADRCRACARAAGRNQGACAGALQSAVHRVSRDLREAAPRAGSPASHSSDWRSCCDF